nr:uncharacterized mitochondrial protein AtMg00810-like [Tanacetum cinerariifolium]
MCAMGELPFFLGLQVKQLPDGIFISQDKYVKDMLKKFDMESVRTTTTPYEVSKHKSKDDPNAAVNVYLFRSMIGSLMYLTASRPDIMFALEAYSDSDYAGSHSDRKFTTGGCQFLGRRLISWQCKKQTVVATSFTEAEYVATAICCGQEIERSSGIDDEVVQAKRQRDDNDLQDERQDQPKEEDVEPKRCKRARTEKSFRPDFVSFMVENEPTSYREA